MRLKIAAKIGIGFGIMTIAVVINALMTSNALEKSRKVNENTTNIYSPSLIQTMVVQPRLNQQPRLSFCSNV